MNTRDERYQNILKSKLGENGIVLLVGQAFVFLLALISILVASIGFIPIESDRKIQ